MRTHRVRCAVAGACLAAALPADASALEHDGVERAVVARVNAARAMHGLPALRASAPLAAAAEAKTREILHTDVLSHASADGTPMAARVRRHVDAGRVGEAIAWISPRVRGKAAAVVASWMRSAPHRGTLLDGGFARIGVSRHSGRLGRARVTVLTADLASAR